MSITNWQQLIDQEGAKPYGQELRQFLVSEYQTQTIYPPVDHVFEAFRLTPLKEVKVVILGQDPYHGKNQAHGLSFSVRPGNRVPPSLRNMYRELQSDLGIEPVEHGYLASWAKQGVLMFNTVMTVREGQANSHRKQGWETFTDHVIEVLNQQPQPLVFVLWGRAAQNKSNMIDTVRHTIIKGTHPSPLSAHNGFFGSRPFSKVNQALEKNGQTPINWQLPQTVIVED